MRKRETLDYLKLCSNYYSNNEDGTCMESCEYYNHNECPVVYVNGLITELKEQLALTEKALELACEEADDLLIKSEGWIFGLCREGSFDKYSELEKKGFEIQGQCNYFKEKAKEIMESDRFN